MGCQDDIAVNARTVVLYISVTPRRRSLGTRLLYIATDPVQFTKHHALLLNMNNQ